MSKDTPTMPKRYYPAVIEHTEPGTTAVWFPDFPDCVAAASNQDMAMQKAERALRMTVDKLAEDGTALPTPSSMETIPLPGTCNVVAFALVGVDLPDPSERVNVYLPRSLLAEADNYAEALGMSRSSFFGLAISIMMGRLPSQPSGPIARPSQG
ncbi:MAG: type II toxin-antitoxin system HicB family antitoxin [Rhizomicrobium sp.]